MSLLESLKRNLNLYPCLPSLMGLKSIHLRSLAPTLGAAKSNAFLAKAKSIQKGARLCAKEEVVMYLGNC